MLYKIIAWLLATKVYRRFARNVLSGWTLRIYGYPLFKGSNYWQIKDVIRDPG